MNDLDGFRLLFGLAALAFGGWLFPKWRRERAANQKRRATRGPRGLFGGRLAPREMWLFLNSTSALALGGLLVGAVVLSMIR